MLDWCFKQKVVDLKKITLFVLDEADIMIDTQGLSSQSIRIQRWVFLMDLTLFEGSEGEFISQDELKQQTEEHPCEAEGFAAMGLVFVHVLCLVQGCGSINLCPLDSQQDFGRNSLSFEPLQRHKITLNYLFHSS